MKIWPVSTLMNPKAGKASYLLTAWASATIPALVILAVVSSLLPPEMMEAVNQAVLNDDSPLVLQVVMIVIAAPLIETAMMVAIFAVLSIMRIPLWAQCVTQAILWGLLHGYFALAWAFAPTWLFFIFSVVYTTRRENSGAEAFGLTAAVHALNNGLASSFVVAEALS